MKESRSDTDAAGPEATPIPPGALVERTPAWEMIEAGRYQPRRIRGSLLGRELG